MKTAKGMGTHKPREVQVACMQMADKRVGRGCRALGAPSISLPLVLQWLTLRSSATSRSRALGISCRAA